MSKCNECGNKLFYKNITLVKSKREKKGVSYCPYCQKPKEDLLESASWKIEETLPEYIKNPDSTVNLAGEIFGYISSGYSDYIAARQLLLSNQNLSGAIFACQALEKLLKALVVKSKDETFMNYSIIEPFMDKHRPYEIYQLYISNVTSLKNIQDLFLIRIF